MRGGMDPVNTNTRSNERRLIQLYDYLHSTKDRNSHYFKDLFKQIKELEEEIERKKKLKQQKNQNNQIIRNTIRYNNKKRNYVQDFIAGIFLPGDKYDIEEDVAFRHALRNSKGIRDEAELTRIIEEAKIARKNRKNIFKTTKATLNSIPTNTMWAYKR
jgi:TolA-binding protein